MKKDLFKISTSDLILCHNLLINSAEKLESKGTENVCMCGARYRRNLARSMEMEIDKRNLRMNK